MNELEVITQPRQLREVRPEDFAPIFTPEAFVERKRNLDKIIGTVLNEGGDYGKIPGAGDKKVLLKPGAEKLATTFGLTPRYIPIEEIEDWNGTDHGGEPLFYVKYKCELWRGDRLLGEAIGSCNSWESKYRYRWISVEECTSRGIDAVGLLTRGGKRTLFEWDFSLDKAETSGAYGKPAEHWQMFRDAIANGSAKRTSKTTKKGESPGYEITVDTALYRIPNPDFPDVINTVQKMAQKRALVAAVLVATNASDSFTQDIEDFTDGSEAAAQIVAQEKIAGLKAAKGEPDPPELTEWLRKAAKSADRTDTYAAMGVELERLGGDSLRDDSWASATAGKAPYDVIIRRLYAAIVSNQPPKDGI